MEKVRISKEAFDGIKRLEELYDGCKESVLQDYLNYKNTGGKYDLGFVETEKVIAYLYGEYEVEETKEETALRIYNKMFIDRTMPQLQCYKTGFKKALEVYGIKVKGINI